MSIVRIGQPALTRVLPHQGNKRWHPAETSAGEYIFTGDSWTLFTPGSGAYPDFIPEQAGFTYTNNGIVGSTVFDQTGPDPLVLRIDGELAATPNAKAVVVCTSGGNDIIRKWNGLNTFDLGDLQTGVNVLTDQILGVDMVPIWADIPTTGLYDPDPLDCLGLIRDYSAWLREFCAAAGYPFIPLYTTFCDGDAGIKPAYGGPTATHMNIAGQKLLAQMVLAAIKAVRR